MFIGIGLGVTAGRGGDDAGLSGADGLNFQRDRYRLNGVGYASLMAVPGVTYSRTGAATAWRADGTLAEFAPNVPRITDRGVLIEGQRTNLLVNSALAGGATVTSWGSVGSDTASSVLSTIRARDFVASASRPWMAQAVAVAAASTYCFSVLVESVSAGQEASQLILYVALNDASITWPVCPANPSGGPYGIVQPGRLHFVMTTVSAGSPQFRMGLGVSGNATGAARLSLPQLEQASDASSPIITTGAAATVGADNLALVLPAGVTSYSAEYGGNLTATGPATPGPFDLATGRPWLNSALRKIIFS